MVGIIHWSSMKNYMWIKRKKNVKKKSTNEEKKKEEKRMRMKCENEMKRKEGRKGGMWWEKERIGGWSRSEKICTPLVIWFCI